MTPEVITQADRDAAAAFLEWPSWDEAERFNQRAPELAEMAAFMRARIASQTVSSGEVGELVERLRAKAHTASEVSKMLAEAKSERQEDNPERRKDLYAWHRPEHTDEWKAADALTTLQEGLAAAVAAEREACAKLAEEWNGDTADGNTFFIAEAIRERGNPPTGEK